MKSSLKHVSGSQKELEVEISPEEVALFTGKALELLGKDIELQGFRKGTAPQEMVQQAIAPEYVFEQASKMAIQDAYGKAITEHKLDPLGAPEVRVTKIAENNPLVFQVSLSVLPEFQLPDYKSVAQGVQKKAVSVEEQEVQKALEWLQQSRQQEGAELPALSDEFAQSVGAFETLATLKNNIQEGLQREKETQEVDRIRQEILEKIAEKISVDIPPVLISQEQHALKEEMQRSIKQTLNMELPEYFAKINKTEQDVEKSLAEQAEKRVKGFLILREIAKQEEIKPTEQEVQEEMNKILAGYPNPKEAQKQLDPERLKTYTEGVLVNEKTFQLLESYIAN
jgi:FKBP-type peptidyl-prolyl cis-trans isomerase (trigger factor)